MSDQTTTVMVVQPDTPSFLSTSVDLKKLLRAVSKESAKAIDVLVKLMGSNDEKIRLTAASKLLEFQVTVADKISQDQMSRLIAQVKLHGPSQGTLVPLPGQKDDKRPLVDFTTVREVT